MVCIHSVHCFILYFLCQFDAIFGVSIILILYDLFEFYENFWLEFAKVVLIA